MNGLKILMNIQAIVPRKKREVDVMRYTFEFRVTSNLLKYESIIPG